MLNIPGSQIEDRQYELNLNGLAVLTGLWSEIEEKSKKRAKPILKTMGENPGMKKPTCGMNVMNVLYAKIKLNLQEMDVL